MKRLDPVELIVLLTGLLVFGLGLVSYLLSVPLALMIIGGLVFLLGLSSLIERGRR